MSKIESKLQSLVDYGSDDDSSEDTTENSETAAPVVQFNDAIKSSLNAKIKTLDSCPLIDESIVVKKPADEFQPLIDPVASKELSYNPKFEHLFAPEVGPAVNPFQTEENSGKNFLTGFIEQAHVNDYQFESQRRIFHSYGVANDPSDANSNTITKGIASSQIGVSIASSTDDPQTTDKKAFNPIAKRKRLKNFDSSDIEGYTGPWAKYEDEVNVSKPSAEEQAEIDEFLAKKKKYTQKKDDKEFEEKAILHISDPYDYQNRSFLHAPQDLDVNLRSDHIPAKCFLPKKLLFTYTGHSKALSAIRWFPLSAHLFLSAGMDAKIKLWEVYNQRRCIMTYLGHKQAVRDICFNRRGDRFLSSGYDRFLKLWDTETGQCVKKFNNRKIAYCVRFNPDEERSHLFLTGMSDKKILCWDTRSGNIVQEYDRHLGAINTITFVDNNRRFVSTSDDKSLRVWEWDIPVDIKYIADPGLHSMPAVSPAPNGKWLACQSMDNKIQAFACMNRFKLNGKKIFTGHMVAGYACSPDFSPDMSYLVSGDADGKVFIWDWKTTKLLKSFQAHENVCISTLWHPHETSKVLSAGWDNTIKLWD
ncbi:hypothetical protein B4U79_03317 [Dinothrombium tinctorium]|uniref:Pre-mRNA-processing factor 17 n=1 Tax=Dinothrombium tinctorium TaxID=1965070 RepID=A0A443RA99_9ACAR|nr:hypothetical protein B4U79_03317 [Dinothrombium tinctorium]